MEYWTTLMYAGQVVLTLGFEGDVGKTNCEALATVMVKDITAAYSDPAKTTILDQSMFPNQTLFEAKCFPGERPETAEKYRK
jgi:hypothetical protein